jgi:hypothetical protein
LWLAVLLAGCADTSPPTREDCTEFDREAAHGDGSVP